jgi:hypothetical protein
MIVNQLDQIRVVIDHEVNSKTNEFHHVFLVRISDENLDKTMSKVGKFLKKEWYSLYWKGDLVLVQYRDRVFRISFKNPSTHKEAIKYCESQGIEREFLSFNNYISSYKRYTKS